MKKLIFLLSFFVTYSFAFGQSYRVYFSDKGENIEMLQNPFTFLSPKSIENKAKRKVQIDDSDLPVSKEYLNEITEQNIHIKMKSRWMNYALVEGENLEQLLGLPFVKKIEKAKKYLPVFAGVEKAAMIDYGASENQVKMISGDYLHDLGFLGEGMTIAVLDGGFSGAQNLNGLDSLWLNGRISATYNFITKDTNVFQDGTHGTLVLSVMGGFIENQFVGTAPRANYMLLKSENQSSETPAEMDNWLAAAEFADSAGADVINSSLGYNKFDGGVGDLEHEDLDGNTALVTRAADLAARKGLLVIVSAGNEGNNSWQRITAPADADSALAIGAVDRDEKYASFSGQGPTADGRIKPDVAAQGRGTAFLLGGGPGSGNGTSFSCPVVAGMAACLWQGQPGKTNMEIYDAIRESGSQRYTPDNLRGFGIPNFRDASWSISLKEERLADLEIEVFPNPVEETFSLVFKGIENQEEVSISILNPAGQRVDVQNFTIKNGEPIKLRAPDSQGVYFISIQIGQRVFLKKIVR